MAGSLADIQQKVYTITNRPDLNIETSQAIARALNFSHMGRPQLGQGQSFPNANFSFDVVEGVQAIPIDPTTGSPALNFSFALPARFRGPQFKYLYCDAPVNCPSINFPGVNANTHLDYVTPAGLFDRQSLLKQCNCYYIAGQNVVIKTDVSRSNLYWGYFQIPSIADSWVVQNFDDLIAWKASAEIFAMLDDNKKTYYESLANQQLAELITSYQDV